ncbi:MAG: AAA family ATPase [Myxococcales bacterium]|nr:AAA family ATPase [Myxococcales bacterium]
MASIRANAPIVESRARPTAISKRIPLFEPVAHPKGSWHKLRVIEDPAATLKTALATAARGLVERESLVELVALAAVAGEHLLVVGPPGTAKSEAVRRVARVLGGTYFEYLLGRFTEPSEIFGPVDLKKLRDGVVETETTGMLPRAEIAFLDEVFLGSTAILNTLLGVLNERTFRRGHTHVPVPLRVCVGATNTLPQDEALAAFADRFLVRAFVEPIADPRLEDLLEGGWALEQVDLPPIGMAHLDRLGATARAMHVSLVRPALAEAIRTLRANGVMLSDRRMVKAQRLVAAAAAMAGRAAPTEADLWPLIYAVPTEDAQEVARDALRPLLTKAESATLPAAAEEAALGPAARARRLVGEAERLLGAPPEGDDERRRWRLRLEGVAREIDAGFLRQDLPQDLLEVRTKLVELLGGDDAATRGAAS